MTEHCRPSLCDQLWSRPPTASLTNYLKILAVRYDFRRPPAESKLRRPNDRPKRSRFPPSGVCPTICGKRSSLSSPNTIPRRGPDAPAWIGEPSWTPSSSGSGRAASVTACPRSFPTTRPCIALSSDGSNSGCSIGSGRHWSRSARSLGVSTGSGRRPTGRWAGPVVGDLVGQNPTDRGKNGVKRSLLVEADGGPLSVVAGANMRDDKLLEATIDAIVVERPRPTEEALQHICFWTRATTTGRVGGSWENATTSPTSDASVRRSSTIRARSDIRRGGGW